jgi:hypothetical protein
VGAGCNYSVAGRQPLSSRVNRDIIGLLVLSSGDDRLVTGDRAKVPAVEGVRVGWWGRHMRLIPGAGGSDGGYREVPSYDEQNWGRLTAEPANSLRVVAEFA